MAEQLIRNEQVVSSILTSSSIFLLFASERRSVFSFWAARPKGIFLSGQYASVAQLDRASDSDSEGRAFESRRAYQAKNGSVRAAAPPFFYFFARGDRARGLCGLGI